MCEEESKREGEESRRGSITRFSPFFKVRTVSFDLVWFGLGT